MLEALDLQPILFYVAQLQQIDLFASFLLFLVLWITRKIAVSVIRARTELQPQEQRRLLTSSRNVFLFLMLLGLVLIWAPQLRTFALSLTAVAVAIVVATKELILCFSGAVLRATSRAFGVGDWIEVGDTRGEVIDLTLLATTVQEFGIGSHAYMPTGRIVVFPNSMLLITPVRNYTALREHTYHSFAITLEPSQQVSHVLAGAGEIVHSHFVPFREKALQANKVVERRTRTDLPDPAPLVRLRTSDLGKLRLEVTLFCPSQVADQLESDITSEILAACQKSTSGGFDAVAPEAAVKDGD